MEKNQKIKIEIWGGYHNQMDPIRIMVDPAEYSEGLNYLMSGDAKSISKSTIKKVKRHMCGMSDCLCGVHHGWKSEII